MQNKKKSKAIKKDKKHKNHNKNNKKFSKNCTLYLTKNLPREDKKQPNKRKKLQTTTPKSVRPSIKTSKKQSWREPSTLRSISFSLKNDIDILINYKCEKYHLLAKKPFGNILLNLSRPCFLFFCLELGNASFSYLVLHPNKSSSLETCC